MKYLLLVLTAMAGILSPAMGQSVSTVTAPQRGTVLVQSYAPASQTAAAATYTSPVQDEAYRQQLQAQAYALEQQRVAADQQARAQELHLRNMEAQVRANESLLGHYQEETLRQRAASGNTALWGQRMAVARDGLSTVHQAATLVQHGFMGQKVKPGHVFAAQVLQGGGGWNGNAHSAQQYAQIIAGMATLPPVQTHWLGR